MKRIISISLALVMFFMNIGLTYATHLCGGRAVAHELSLGESIDGCGMESSVAQSDACDTQIKWKSCCADQITDLSIDADQQSPSVAHFDLDNDGDVVAWIAIEVPEITATQSKSALAVSEDPPFILQQTARRAQLQTYLI